MTRPETITSEYVRGFRAGESSALGRAAQIAAGEIPGAGEAGRVSSFGSNIAHRIRALASPAAAPAAGFSNADKPFAKLTDPLAPSLLPRVLAALLRFARRSDYQRGEREGDAIRALAAELRRYIADQPAACDSEESPK